MNSLCGWATFGGGAPEPCGGLAAPVHHGLVQPAPRSHGPARALALPSLSSEALLVMQSLLPAALPCPPVSEKRGHT